MKQAFLITIILSAACFAQLPKPGGGSAGGSGFVSDPTKSGAVALNGVTSGTVAISAADVAGTAIVYVMPSTNGSAGQVLTDNGVTTCPTLAAGLPATCHQLVWGVGATTSGTAKNICYQSVQSNTTGNATIFTCSIAGGTIPAGACIEVAFEIQSITKISGQTINMVWGAEAAIGMIVQPAVNGFGSGVMDLCNNTGVTNAQQWNWKPGLWTTAAGGASPAMSFFNGPNAAAQDSTVTKILSITLTGGSGSDVNKLNWAYVRGPF